MIDVNEKNKLNNSYLNDPVMMKYINFLVSHPVGIINELQQIKADDKLSDNNEHCSKSKKESDGNNNMNDSLFEPTENNDTLLISEKQNKVILPYTIKEVTDIYEKNRELYNNTTEVIEKVFTRNFKDYKIQFSSRYRETMKLARDREGFGIADSITLALEMIGKRFLHPAIISACRTLDELDVYLDCFDKNELEDFKIFKVKYELYPTVVKNKNDIALQEPKKNRIWNYIKNLFKKSEKIDVAK